MKGTEYEVFVQAVYRALLACDGIEVHHNSRLLGKSGASHQIDVLWNFEKAGVEHAVIVECKDRGRPREKSEIAAFKAVLDDLKGRPLGLFVSKSGFQSGAIDFAKFYGITLLEIRAPNDSDWGDNELLGIRIDIRLRSRAFDIKSLSIELPKGSIPNDSIHSMAERQSALALGRRLGPHLQDKSGKDLGQLIPLLEPIAKGLSAGSVHTHTFPAETYVVLEGESVSRALAVSCTYLFEDLELQRPIVVDFRKRVRAVVNDIIEKTQIRIDQNMRPSPKFPR